MDLRVVSRMTLGVLALSMTLFSQTPGGGLTRSQRTRHRPRTASGRGRGTSRMR